MTTNTIRSRQTITRWSIVLWLLIGLVTDGSAQSTTKSGLNWHFRDIDTGAVLAAHRRVDATLTDRAADWLRIRAGYGTQALVSQAIPAARVISELSVTVPLRSDRVGLQAMVRVVLPRTHDAQSGGPITILIPGTSSDSTTEWNSLVVHEIPKQLERRVRILQLSYDDSIDIREAYIDMILVNVYGGAGVTNVTIGDPIIRGAAAIPEHGLDGAAFHNVAYRSVRNGRDQKPRTDGNALLSDGRPLFVQMVDDHGEQWSFLKSLGANTIRLQAPVTFEQMATARKLGLWIVSPPPKTLLANQSWLHFDRVLAWDLGTGLAESDLAATQAAARWLRDSDQLSRTPIVCGPTCEMAQFARCANILVHGRTIPHGSSRQTLGPWLRRRIDSAHPSTVHWAAIETQPATATIEQAIAFGCRQTPQLEPALIRSSAITAVANGARGVYFCSRSPWDRDTEETRSRRLAVQRACLELQLIEPWLATGQLQYEGVIVDGHTTSAIHTDRAKLLILIRDESRADVYPPQSSITIPDVSDTTRVYRIGPGGLVPITQRRVAGGAELTSFHSVMADQPECIWLLVTRDQTVVRNLAERINHSAAQIAGIQKKQIEQIQRTGANELPQGFQRAADEFQTAFARHDLARAHAIGDKLLAGRAHAPSNESQRGPWDSWRGSTACPLAIHNNTFDDLRKFLQSTPPTTRSLNLLQGGGCDSVNELKQAAWNSAVDQRRGSAEVSVTPNDPHQGSGCLQIHAAWSEAAGSRIADDRAIAWTSAGPIAMSAGQIVRIDGWLKIEQPLQDGELVIYDSIAGPALGLRFRMTTNNNWQPFTLYRAAPESTDMALSFALTGPGRVCLDEISVAPVLSSKMDR